MQSTMMGFKTQFILVLVSLIACTRSSDLGKYFVLRHPYSGLVLDSSEEWVTLQSFTGFSTQLWRMEPTKKGLSYFVNKHDGRVLDYDSRYNITDSWLVVTDKIWNTSDACLQNVDASDKLIKVDNCQLWYVHYDGVIVNACGNGEVAVSVGGSPIQGTYLRTSRGVGKKFVFQYV